MYSLNTLSGLGKNWGCIDPVGTDGPSQAGLLVFLPDAYVLDLEVNFSVVLEVFGAVAL